MKDQTENTYYIIPFIYAAQKQKEKKQSMMIEGRIMRIMLLLVGQG